jgi:hypothetical protein
MQDPLKRSPYELLAAGGMTPASSHSEVLDRAFDLQASGDFSPEMRQAWDVVRTPSQRLAADFFLVRLDGVPLAERAQNLLAQLPSGG